MIVSAFIIFSTYVLTLVISLFPNSTGLPSSFQTAADTMGSYVGLINTLLPIDALAFAITTLITVQLSIFGFKTFKWVLSHLPWFGGRG